MKKHWLHFLFTFDDTTKAMAEKLTGAYAKIEAQQAGLDLAKANLAEVEKEIEKRLLTKHTLAQIRKAKVDAANQQVDIKTEPVTTKLSKIY